MVDQGATTVTEKTITYYYHLLYIYYTLLYCVMCPILHALEDFLRHTLKPSQASKAPTWTPADPPLRFSLECLGSFESSGMAGWPKAFVHELDRIAPGD